jgi:hypothetical protein
MGIPLSSRASTWCTNSKTIITAGAFGKIERAMHGPADGAVAARIKRDATHRATPNSSDPG